MNFINKIFLILVLGISGNCKAGERVYNNEFFLENKTSLTLKIPVLMYVKYPGYISVEGKLDTITLAPRTEILYEVTSKKPPHSLHILKIIDSNSERELRKDRISGLQLNKAYSFTLGEVIIVPPNFTVKGIIIKEEEGIFPIKKAEKFLNDLNISTEKPIQSKINKMRGEKPYTDMHVITYP